MQYNIYSKISEIGVVPVVKLERVTDAEKLAAALLEGGINTIEVTFRAEGADQVISTISQKFPQMLVGAGTVLTVEQAQRAINAGAKFCVSPCLNEEVVRFCIDNGTPILPGVATSTEIDRAMNLGLTHVKFFPAEQAGGLAYIKAVCAPFSGIEFMPTGGINAQNLSKYLSFKRVFACGGSWMVSAELLKANNWQEISRLSAQAVEIAKTAKIICG